MKVLVMSGGRHPYEESTPILEGFLKGAGHDVTVVEDATVLADSSGMSAYDALVFNTRRENLPDFGDWELQDSEKEGLRSYIKSGNGFVCIHIACCVPSGWAEFDDITGGGWVTGISYHPPYSEMKVNISNSSHAGARGVSDFITSDELYMNTTFTPEGNDVFLTGDAEDGTWPWGPDRAPTFMPGGTYPLGWTRSYGDGKVFVLLLGHDGRSFETPEFQQIVLNGVDWAGG